MDFNDAIAFATGALKDDERFPDVDLSPGSATFNMVVLPFAVMNKASWDVVEWVQRYLLFTDPDQLGAEQLDNIGKMLMAPPRRTDGGVTVDVSLFFDVASISGEPIVINTTDTFRSGGSVGYPMREHVIVPASLVDVGGTPYKVATIAVRFESSGVIPANSVTQTSVIAAGLDHVDNERPSSDPIATQTNAEYMTVIKNSLSTRNDVNTASIVANYAGAYGVSDIFAIGFGDQEMQRDIAVAARGWSGHIGGRIDAFVRAPLVDSTHSITIKTGGRNATKHTFDFARYNGMDFNGTTMRWEMLPGVPPMAPIVMMDWVNTTIAGLKYDEFRQLDGSVKYKIKVLPDSDDPFWGKNYRYSIYERLSIEVTTSVPGKNNATGNTVNLAYKTLSNLEDMQEAYNTNRLLNCDLLFRSFIPVQVEKLSIVYDGGYYIDESEWAVILANRINGWTSPTGIRFNELLNGIGVPVKFEETGRDIGHLPYVLTETGEVAVDSATHQIVSNPKRDDSKSPSYVVLYMDNIDGTSNRYVSTRQIYPMTSIGLSATYRTCRYFVDPSDIEFRKARSW